MAPYTHHDHNEGPLILYCIIWDIIVTGVYLTLTLNPIPSPDRRRDGSESRSVAARR